MKVFCQVFVRYRTCPPTQDMKAIWRKGMVGGIEVETESQTTTQFCPHPFIALGKRCLWASIFTFPKWDLE